MEIDRRTALLGLAVAAMPVWEGVARAQGTAPSFVVRVPVDHDRPAGAALDLPCEWASVPDPRLRTVLLVADAQQFYLRPGGAARIAGSLFGGSVNVLSIVGRSRADALEKIIRPGGSIDWRAAWTCLRARQWLGDIDAVLAHVGRYGDPRQLMLYGRSGGAFLIQQALVRRPGIASRIFLQAGVNHELDVRLGHDPDSFWRDLVLADAGLARSFRDFLTSNPEERAPAIALLQRQHFFVEAAALPAARVSAIRAIMARDRAVLAEMRSAYQLDALEAMRETAEGVASTVRLAEFALPHRDPRLREDRITPDIEQLFNSAAPVLPLIDRPARAAALSDWSRLARYRGQALILAARHDQTCDFRTQQHLARQIRESRLLLVDDNHVFARMGASGLLPPLLLAFAAGSGLNDRAVDAVAAQLGASGLLAPETAAA